jgi:hypothetical protein
LIWNAAGLMFSFQLAVRLKSKAATYMPLDRARR